MTNETMLKKINYILEKDNQTIKEKLLQFKQEIEIEIMQDSNSNKNKSLKTVAKACLDILKVQKSRPILQKAVIRNGKLELTDGYRLVNFNKSDYVEIPTHNEEETSRYPSFDILMRDTRKNDIEITLDIEEIRNKYKIYKTLNKVDKEKFENLAYNVYYDKDREYKIYASLEFLNNMLDIFSQEKEFKVKVNSYYDIKPILFESDNITAIILPIRK